MRKKSLLIVFYILIVFCFAIFLTSCNESTVEELINDYGIMLEGGSFEDGSILVSEEIKFNTAQEDWGLMNYWFLTNSEAKNDGKAILWGNVKDVLQDGIELTNSNATIVDGSAVATLEGKNVITFENNTAYILSIEEQDAAGDELIAREDEKCVAQITTDASKGNIVKFTNAKGDVEIQYYTKNKANSTALEGVFEIKYPLTEKSGSIKQQFNINIYGQGINVEKNTVPTFFAGELKASIDAVTV